MKKLLLALVLPALLLSCRKNGAEKPEHLLSEKEMTDVLYDMSLLQAMKSYNTVSMEEKGINPRTYIYKKYKIDSLTLSKNHQYYASDLEKYEKMLHAVADRIRAEKDKTLPANANKQNSGIAPEVKQNDPQNRFQQLK
ncbi:DUF4296 domain-containing protein [Flavobacterium sp. RNTU_13]|uniref:DUF4296 domain-containing protein n=1 Tax=Flavobacterium sp. RNTU_13 TaxID=3375145 RepID=UPI00398795F8